MQYAFLKIIPLNENELRIPDSMSLYALVLGMWGQGGRTPGWAGIPLRGFQHPEMK